MTDDTTFFGEDFVLSWKTVFDSRDVPLDGFDELYDVLERIEGFAGAIETIAERADVSRKASAQLSAQVGAIRIYLRMADRLSQFIQEEMNKMDERHNMENLKSMEKGTVQ